MTVRAGAQPMAAMTQSAQSPGAGTLDAGEVDRFGRLAAEWWDPNGKFRTLHQIGPARLAFVRDAITRHLPPPPDAGLRVLEGLSIVDVGCGGGLVTEPLARLGARTMGIEPAAENIAAAQRHAEAQGLAIDYQAVRAEDLVAAGAQFDAVVCLEVVEHVPDPGAFVGILGRLVRPGGVIVLSTINRTLRSYALAIVGAEYILRWVPAGTHQWNRFVTPDELVQHLTAAGLVAPQFEGLVYDPLRDRWRLAADTAVNYLASAVKPG